jgi:exonuclease SbcD
MRILHTADWHLCDKLGRNDRTEDLNARVQQVADLCAEHGVEVVLIAGDLFSEQASLPDMARALQFIRTAFQPFFQRGGTILAVTGNHDRDTKIDAVRSGMLLASPNTAGSRELQRGRMYLFNSPAWVKLSNERSESVQFVLVPYPFAGRYGLSAQQCPTKEEENRKLREYVGEYIADRSRHQEFDLTLPTVLVAHLHVFGSETHTLYKMSEKDDHCFAFADLQTQWAYAALGHIHKPQCLNGAEHVRYPGTLDRLDFGEPAGQQGVVLFDVSAAGATGIQRLPLESTPFLDLTITDLDAELPCLAERYPDAAKTIARFTLTPSATVSRDDATRQLRRLFPRWHEIRWHDPKPEGDAPAMSPKRELAEGVREYLNGRLKDDPDRDAILNLAEQFLAKAVQP